MDIIINDFMSLYNDTNLPAQRIQYKEYVGWQNSVENIEIINKQEEYWLNKYSGEIPVLNLPTDYSRPVIQSFEGSSINFEIGRQETQSLKDAAKSFDVTLFMILLTAFNILLSKLADQEEIIVGTPVAGRRHADLEDIIGIFLNTLPLRSHIPGERTFIECLEELKGNTLSAFENQEYPFEDLVEKVEVNRDTSRNPIFDVMLVLQNMDISEVEIPGLKLKPFDYENKTSKFDLTLQAMETEDNLLFSLEYCTKLFKQETIERFITYFKKIVLLIAVESDVKISEIEIISEKEKNKIVYELNETEIEYPHHLTIHELFEEKALVVSNQWSVVSGSGDGSISYGELNERANQLARLLREKGVKPDTIVGIIAEPSIQMIVGILGILKSGGAYLPIERDNPGERIDLILNESRVEILLKTGELGRASEIDFKGEMIDLDDKEIYQGNHFNLGKISGPENLAYVIYTSGTTGRPKGVMIEHRSVVNYVWWAAKNYVRGETINFPLYTSLSFDLTVTSIFTPLITGNSIIVYGREDKELLIEKVMSDGDDRFGVIKLTPAHLKVIRDMKIESKVKRFIVGGEDLESKLARDINRKLNGRIEIFNEYGPTEATVGCMIYKFNPKTDKNKSVPIGIAADNAKIYILDKRQKPVPMGVNGEIFISGEGVSRGYLNNLELTEEKFIIDSYDSGKKMYRSGDLGRWLPEGNIEFFGRVDDQVKIKGFRIELGDIESQLLGIDYIKEALVIDREDGEDKYLCAYIVSDIEIDISEIRNLLSDKLPDYMIPTRFVQIEKIPLTVNGKVDRRVLPAPEVVSGEEYAAPRDEKEETLCKVYSEVLGVDRVGINDIFFEIGGDSIKAIQITSRIQKYKLKLTVVDLFRHPKISDLSKYVGVLDREIDQGNVKGEISLTPIQRWFFSNSYTDSFHFNHSVMLYRREGFDVGILESLFTRITEHHDALRIIYKKKENKMVQINKGVEGNHFDLKVFDLKEISNDSEFIRDKANEIQGSINLSEGPLLKLGCFKTGDGDHLLIVIHHLVIDGISWRILLEDISSGYELADQGKEIRFQSKTDSFMYWSEQQKKYSESQKLLKEISFWRHIEEADIEPLPRDYEIESSQKRFRNQETSIVMLSKEDTDKLLRECNRSYITEINDLLLTALGLSVNEWSGGITRILINLEGHGREEIIEGVDISRTVGWFTSQYPVLLKIENSEDISYMIRYVKESLRRIPNKGIGYGILRYLTPGDKREGLEFFSHPEISFNYLGEFSGGSTGKSIFSMSGMPPGDSISSNLETDYTININGMTAEGQLSLSFSYNKYEYKKETIEELCSLYKKYLLLIINHCLNQDKVKKTPSDLGDMDISIEELKEIESMF
jgi:amino acid adenylation domain-containing protein/non-ribosomal peptide synthase protein (TIGR01720 family)